MNWKRVMEGHGYRFSDDGYEPDPFFNLSEEVNKRTHQRATVSMDAGRSLSYGELRCSARVTLQCPQTETSINLAGEVAFLKALELADEAMETLLERERKDADSRNT